MTKTYCGDCYSNRLKWLAVGKDRCTHPKGRCPVPLMDWSCTCELGVEVGLNLVEKEHDIWDKHDPRNLCTRPPHVESPCNGYPRADCPGYREKSVSKWCAYHQTDSHSEGDPKYNCGVKNDPAIGIDPDYDNKIPEPKKLKVEALVELLNKETFGPKKWRVFAEQKWEWSGDYVAYWPSGHRLQFNGEDIGILQGNWDQPYDTFDSIIILDDATLQQARFIKECTGWNIEV